MNPQLSLQPLQPRERNATAYLSCAIIAVAVASYLSGPMLSGSCWVAPRFTMAPRQFQRADCCFAAFFLSFTRHLTV